MATNTVYVGNVESTVDEFTIKSIFENCGTVTNVRLAGKPGYNTMYCFVEYADPSMAQCALALDGLQLGSRQVKVSLAKGTTGGGGGGGGVPGAPGVPPPPYGAPAYMGAGAGMAALAPYGVPPGAAALLPYGAAALGLPAGAPGAPPGHRAAQDPHRVAKTIYVDGVPSTVAEDALATFFAMCGTVIAVRAAPPSGAALERRAWIEYGTVDGARLALQYDGTVMGGSTLRVTPSRTAIHTNALRGPVAGGAAGGAPAGVLPGPPPRPGEPPAAAAGAASIAVPGGDANGAEPVDES